MRQSWSTPGFTHNKIHSLSKWIWKCVQRHKYLVDWSQTQVALNDVFHGEQVTETGESRCGPQTVHAMTLFSHSPPVVHSHVQSELLLVHPSAPDPVEHFVVVRLIHPRASTSQSTDRPSSTQKKLYESKSEPQPSLVLRYPSTNQQPSVGHPVPDASQPTCIRVWAPHGYVADVSADPSWLHLPE